MLFVVVEVKGQVVVWKIFYTLGTRGSEGVLKRLYIWLVSSELEISMEDESRRLRFRFVLLVCCTTFCERRFINAFVH